MPAATLILASASPRRKELLARLDQPFSIVATDVDESVQPGEQPRAYALRLAEAKARAAAVTDGDAAVLGADTIVVLDGRILGKPEDAAQAVRFLQDLRGRPHEVLTAVAVAIPCSDRLVSGVERTVVHMRHYTDTEIAAYVATLDPFDKAGGYAIQHDTFRPVATIEGSYSNVMGLPLGLTARLLVEAGARDAVRSEPESL